MSSGSSIVTGISSGLSNTYAYLASIYKDGVTYENITEARSDGANAMVLNQSFASYLQNNFANLDTDKDGIISAEEMNKLTSMISTAGVSKTELSQLASSGLSSEMLTKIMENFDEIDANHDGRVTSAEITAFTHSCSKQEKLDEENYKKATDMSLFYGSESTSEPASYSLLSYKYKNFNSK